MIGTLDKVLADHPEWAYLDGRADPPPVKARRTRTPRATLYARADHQTLILPAVVGDTDDGDDDKPPLYQVGGKLREWCDANCLRETTEPEPKTAHVPAAVAKQQIDAYRRMP